MFIGEIISSPSLTGSAPFGRKSFCISTMIKESPFFNSILVTKSRLLMVRLLKLVEAGVDFSIIVVAPYVAATPIATPTAALFMNPRLDRPFLLNPFFSDISDFSL